MYQHMNPETTPRMVQQTPGPPDMAPWNDPEGGVFKHVPERRLTLEETPRITPGSEKEER